MVRKQRPDNRLITAVLGIAALVVLVLNLPSRDVLVSNGGLLVIYGVLVALALHFGMIDGELSPAHGVGMLALLSLPHEAFAASLWIIALASALGQLAFALRQDANATTPDVILVAVRMTLSFFAAGLVYHGDLPLGVLDDANLTAVLVYGVVYGAIYFGLFALEQWLAGKLLSEFRASALEYALIVLLPIPFAALGAMILTELGLLPFFIYLGSLGLILLRRRGAIRSQRMQIQAISTSADQQIVRNQQEQVSQLATLNRLLALLTDTLSPETVIDTVISSASTISNASAVAMYLFREDTLSLVRAAGLSDTFHAKPPAPLIAEDGRDFEDSVLVGSVERDAPALGEVMAAEDIAAWIELPLSYQNVPLGVLVIYYDEPTDFSADLLELLRTFAKQSAQAISNARLYEITDEALEKRVGQLLALGNIGHHLTATLEVRAICDLVVEYALQVTGANAAAILLIGEGGEVEHTSVSGYPPGAIGKGLDLIRQGITGVATRTCSTVRVGDVQTEPKYLALVASTRSQLSSPIMWNEAVAGVITLESDRLNGFTEEDTYFVQQLANQAIIAIENARLFRKVAESRDRMQVILNTVTEGIILINTVGEVVLANPRVDLMGLQAETLIRRSLDQLLEEPDFAERLGFRTGSELHRLVKELRAPGGLAAREPKVFSVGDDDPRFVERQIFPVYDESEQPLGVLLVFYDETEEMKLAKTREEVSQMLIHDLRSPLTAVTTSLKLLSDLTPKDSEFRPLVETTTDSSRRAIRKLLSRVDALLDVARMENGELAIEPKPTELATLVDNVCVELSPIAQELDVSIKPEISAEMPLLDIDADKVERLLLNLVDNALKFSPSHSTVIVRAHEPGAEDAAPGFVRIDVMDSGPGVPDEYKLILFDRFVQVRGRQGARRGTGLGLTFCRLVTETHGGRIWVDNNPTGGSIFAFTLPVALDRNGNGSGK
ncbi:MAG: GAF domain-containing protein [Anaerolineae bacterium]|nr:GAF domain-containing protein [Anaerolineae bacterium]